MRTGGLSNGNLKGRLRANRRDFLAMKKNNIPFSFLVSILKPLIKIPQFKNKFVKQKTPHTELEFFNPGLSYFPADTNAMTPHVELF
jgi:hypothetical protein